ncbi:MAG: QcrA and Rieske domain-containing protein [Georgenia sp.]
MSATDRSTSRLTRRQVLDAGLAAAPMIAVVPILAACGGDRSSPGASPPTVAANEPIAALADVPVGSALVVGETVLVQPEKGTVAGLSAVCTHQGCLVAVDATELACPCHGSRFALDGAVVQGPASRPLPPVPVRIEGADVVAG